MCFNILYEAFAIRGYSMFGNPSEEIPPAFNVFLFALDRSLTGHNYVTNASFYTLVGEAYLVVLLLKDIRVCGYIHNGC